MKGKRIKNCGPSLLFWAIATRQRHFMFRWATCSLESNTQRLISQGACSMALFRLGKLRSGWVSNQCGASHYEKSLSDVGVGRFVWDFWTSRWLTQLSLFFPFSWQQILLEPFYILHLAASRQRREKHPADWEKSDSRPLSDDLFVRMSWLIAS